MPSETVAFEPRSRPLSVIVWDSLGVEIERKEYVWDVASRVTDALEGGVWSAYSFDAIDQLIAEAKPSVSYSASYSFDANGNRLSRTVNGVTETYAYDDADKLLSITGGFNPRTYSYDLAGRTTAISGVGGTTQFDYDYDGQVTQITYPSLATDSFTYNGLGARATSSGVSGSRTFKRGGLSVTSPVLSDGVAQYTPGISRRENEVSTFQHSGLKNASAQSSASGAVTASRVYDAYGNLVSSTGTWQGPFGYGGAFGYQEEANGLKLLGHRYYDPDTGRFLTPDPIGSGRNWYAYIDNSPVSGFDASGLVRIDIAAGAAATAEEASLWRAVYTLIPNWLRWLAGAGPGVGVTASQIGRHAVRSGRLPQLARQAGETARGYGFRFHQLGKRFQTDTLRLDKVIEGTRMRPDILDKTTKTIIEIKPSNARQIGVGTNQLQRYLEAAQRAYGGDWKGQVWTYDMPPPVQFNIPRTIGGFGSFANSGFFN
ncbi:MAG: hypothetical protein IH944_04650 [Armatimonadetes bacterium]|nr:hypothetical protein [Armatimonadota bacterium]